MKIPHLELNFIRPCWMFLQMHTDKDLIGYGEPILEGQAPAVAEAVKMMEEYLIGKDPRRIEHHWQALYRGSFYCVGPL